MRNIKQLREERHQLKARGEALLHTAEVEGRALTAAEDADFRQLQGRLGTLGVEISAVEAEMDRERNLPASELAGRGARPSRDGRIGGRYADLFGPPKASSFASIEEYFGIIHAGLYDSRLYAGGSPSQQEHVPSQGGFAVPDEYASMLLDAALENEIVRPRAWVTPMSSETKKIAAFDMTDNSGDAPFGGLKLFWMGEAVGDLLPETSKTWQLQLIANKGALFSWVSNELLDDGMSYEQALFNSFARSMGWGMDLAFLAGPGGGTPKGIIGDAALVTVAPISGQAGQHTIVYQNLASMFAQIHPLCVDNSVWICNNSAIPQLLQLTYPGSIGIPVMPQTPDGKFLLLTRPVFFTEKLPTLGTQGDILLCDLSQYAIGLRKEVTVDKSAHAGFTADQTGYRAIVRVAGQGKWNKAITPANGPQLSWCIALQAR